MIIQNITLTNVGYVVDVQPIITSGLVTNYDAHLSTIAGGTFSDLSGNGYDATLYNTPTTTTYNNYTVLQLASASSQYFGYTGGYGTALHTGYTYDVWAYPTSAGVAGTLVGEWEGSNFNTAWTDAQLGFSTSNINGGYFNAGYVLGPSWSANTWYHITFTYDNATPLGTFYVNGVSYGTLLGLKSYPAAVYLSLGKDDNSNGIYIGGVKNYFNGYVGAWKVYNRALTSSEVTQNFNALRWRYNV